jgi:hypothetical protein
VVLFVVLFAVASLGAGCSNDDKRVEGETYLLNSEDFDLETVVGLIKDNKVSNIEELEEQINDDTGLSNVDIDADGDVDYIMIRESREGGQYELDFMAVPSSTNDEADAETIASVQVEHKEGSGDVHVRGGYPSYVHGHHSHYYHYHRPHSGLMTGMFLGYMLSSRSYYYGGYRSGWSSRRAYASSALTSKRSAYRSSKSVSPIKKASKPSSYKIASAAKTRSKLKSGAIKGRTGSSKTFSKRDQFKQKRKASGFGSSKSKSGSSPFGGSKSKSSFGSKKKKKSSWGSSSRSRSRSRSFGGRRRR